MTFLSDSLAPGAAPSCEVVVCTRNRLLKLETCLEHIARQEYPCFQLCVVENGSAQATARRLAAKWGATYIWEPLPGLSRARNGGARQSKCEIVAYLDDDCIATPSWLSRLVAGFADPRTVAVTGRILPTDQAATKGGKAVNDLDVGGQPHLLSRASPLWFERANFGGIGSGGNMAFRRSIFSDWEGFDLRLGRGAIIEGGEEQYAFFTLIDRGFKVAYAPEAIVYHPQHYESGEARARYLAECSAATAYMTFLWANQPRYRRALLRYAGQALLGRKRWWRKSTACQRPEVPAVRTLAARLAGVVEGARVLRTPISKTATSRYAGKFQRLEAERRGERNEGQIGCEEGGSCASA